MKAVAVAVVLEAPTAREAEKPTGRPEAASQAEAAAAAAQPFAFEDWPLGMGTPTRRGKAVAAVAELARGPVAKEAMAVVVAAELVV